MKHVNNDVGSVALKLLFIATFFSIMSTSILFSVEQSRKFFSDNNTKATDVSIGLALVTNLSSSRLCMNAIGANQIFRRTTANQNGGAGRADIQFQIRGIGQIDPGVFNTNLNAVVQSVYLDEIVTHSATTYEGILKYSLSTGAERGHRLKEHTVGKFKFSVDSDNKFVSCVLNKI